jgi:hypothetical protein
VLIASRQSDTRDSQFSTYRELTRTAPVTAKTG